MELLILGILVSVEWPAHYSWFFLHSLNIEIAFRDLIMIFFGLFIKWRNIGD